MKNNRLKEQMENISRHCTKRYLLIEGFFDFSYVNNINYLYSKLAEITLSFDIKVLFSKDSEHTASIIRRIYDRRNFGYMVNTTKKDKIYYAVKLFGVGRKRLEVIFSRFGNIKNIANAEKKEFKGIKSVGKRSIEKLRNVLNSDIFSKNF